SGDWQERQAPWPGHAPTGRAGRGIPRATPRRDESVAVPSLSPLVIVYNLYRLRTIGRPAKADAPLLIDANGMLARAVSLQGLEPIARRRPQVVKTGGGFHHIEFTDADRLDSPPPRRT